MISTPWSDNLRLSTHWWIIKEHSPMTLPRQTLLDRTIAILAALLLAGAWRLSRLAGATFSSMCRDMGAKLPVISEKTLAIAGSDFTAVGVLFLCACLIVKEFKLKEPAARLRLSAAILLLALACMSLVLLSVTLPMIRIGQQL